MDPPRRDGPGLLLAPPARGGAALSFPPADRPRSPSRAPVDEHLVAPEVTRDEVLRGRKLVAQPALAPHADAHADIGGVLRWHVREGYRASVDLLTRVSEGSDFATDVSIRRDGQDPETKQRYLEELSFEIVNEQAIRDVHDKAEELAARGVRRIFAIFVQRNMVCEWSHERSAFVTLGKDAVIEDPCLVRPLAVRALLDAAIAEREAVRALKQRGSPEILALQEEARIEGRRGLFLELLRMRFGALSPEAEAHILAASPATLDTWAGRVLAAPTIDDILRD
jgi:hypothetical protein